MDTMLQDFWHLFTIAWLMALINIIVIDIVMSWDNAIIIGMATRNLPEKLRKKAIIIGIIGATLLRIAFAFFATFLLELAWVRFAGGLLLLYVVWKFFKELRMGTSHHDGWMSWKEVGFLSAISTIIIADVSMSLDNVLAVAGASHGNMVTLGIGLVFSIILMAFASNLIAKSLNKYPIIQWVGLLVILFVAIEMLIKGTPDIENSVHIDNLFPFFVFLISLLFIFVHQRYATPVNEARIKWFIEYHYQKIFLSIFILIVLFFNLGGMISTYLASHEVLKYAGNFILLWLFLEGVTLYRNKK